MPWQGIISAGGDEPGEEDSPPALDDSLPPSVDDDPLASWSSSLTLTMVFSSRRTFHSRGEVRSRMVKVSPSATLSCLGLDGSASNGAMASPLVAAARS